MNRVVLLLAALLLPACGGGYSAEQVEATVNARLTEGAQEATIEPAAEPAATPRPTATPQPKPTQPPRPTAKPDIGTRQNPYRLGDVARLTLSDAIEFTVVIVEVMRGDEAWSIIQAANQFNEPAPQGMEYIVARVAVAYIGKDAGMLELNEFNWAVVTQGRVLRRGDLPIGSVCCLEPEFDVTLFAGGRAEGLMAWPVNIDDPDPVLAIGMKPDGTGGIFFAAER